MFGDRRLQSLIDLALRNNRDLRLAALNVEAAEAQYGIQRAARSPSVDAGVGLNRQRTPANRETDPATPAAVQNQYGVNLGVSAFEIDLFGRVRAVRRRLRPLPGHRPRPPRRPDRPGGRGGGRLLRGTAGARATGAGGTHPGRLAAIAGAGAPAQDAQQAGGLDVAQAEGQVANADADLEARTRAAEQARNALRLLLGTEPPEDLPEPLPLDRQPVVTRLATGLPSELLFRRPDILQAEQQLQAANADIGAARAAFFPRLSLTTSAGFLSPGMRNLFDGGQHVWSFAPQINIPLFQGGRLRAELRLAEVRKSSAVAEYERAIQIAFREVADGLAGRETFSRQIDAQARAVASAERRAELSSQRYRAGVDGRLELLDAQRQLYAAQQGLLDLRRGELSNAIALYKALGGGLTENNSG